MGLLSSRAQPMVCLLRGINVGGRNLVRMAALAGLFEELGCAGARTVRQSGNVVFRAAPRPGLKKRIEDAMEKSFAVRPDAILRSGAELRRAVDANPFAGVERADPAHLLVVFLDGKPAASGAAALQQWDRGPERVRVLGKDCYVHYPAGIGRSKLTAAVLEGTLRARGTGRNWNTLLELIRALEDEG